MRVSALPPVIDGDITDAVWDNAARYEVEMTNGRILEMKILTTSDDLYFSIDLPHDDPSDVIITNTSVPHDYFGIEFDNNFDNAIMGRPTSPDDLIMIDYDRPGYRDMFMHSYRAFTDDENNGVDDGDGASGSVNGHLIWEFRKPLDSGDKNGYDVSLKSGDEFRIMLGFWDNKPIHTAAAFTNTYNENSLFRSYFVGEVVQRLVPNLIVGLFSLVAAGMTYILRKGVLV